MSDRFEVPIAGGLDVPLPRMARVRQTSIRPVSTTWAPPFAPEMERPDVAGLVKPGRFAVGCGSRGVANIVETAKTVVEALKRLGAEPFLFPAMGSHGGATALGQTGVLANYGITEAAMGKFRCAPPWDTVVIGELDDGTPIHVDRYAHEADGIVLINRIKRIPISGPTSESGIVKMIGIGMGKHAGATALHFHDGPLRRSASQGRGAGAREDPVPVGVGLSRTLTTRR